MHVQKLQTAIIALYISYFLEFFFFILINFNLYFLNKEWLLFLFWNENFFFNFTDIGIQIVFFCITRLDL